MSDKPRKVKVGERASTLSLAVKLVDAVTGRRPAGNPRVRIEGSDAKPAQNLSGYHLFVDFEPVDDPVTVHVDTGERYQDQSREVDLSDRDPSRHVEIELAPAVSYPFPAASTLVRGHVLNGDGAGVDGASLSVRSLDHSIETDATGEFVLFFGGDGELEFVRDEGEEGGKRVKVDGSDPVIEIRKPSDSDPILSATLDGDEYPAVEEGSVSTLNIVID